MCFVLYGVVTSLEFCKWNPLLKLHEFGTKMFFVVLPEARKIIKLEEGEGDACGRELLGGARTGRLYD